jgi:hypothetical protein
VSLCAYCQKKYADCEFRQPGTWVVECALFERDAQFDYLDRDRSESEWMNCANPRIGELPIQQEKYTV